MRFGIFDHIEPVPGQRLDQIYHERLVQIERLDFVGERPSGLPVREMRRDIDAELERFDQDFVASFQWGDLTHAQAMRSIELFSRDVMPRYARPSAVARAYTS